MGLVANALERRSTLANPSEWLKDALIGPRSATGRHVGPEQALSLGAVYACVSLISETIASLPWPVYRRTAGNQRERNPGHPLYRLLHDRPNPEMSAYNWRDCMVGNLELQGNAYAEIELDRGERPIALWPLRPDRMVVERIGGQERRLRYQYTIPNGRSLILPPERVLHWRGPSSDGLIGHSRVTLARETFGLGLALEEYGSRFFGNDSRPGGVLETPGRLSDDAAKRLKTRWEDAHRGLSNAHRVAVLEEGVSWKAVGIPPQDAQFLECTVAGTLFSMADGTRQPVEALRPGDLVLGWENGPVPARVRAVGAPQRKPLVRITTARGRTLTASADHPCLVKPRLRTPGGRADPAPPVWTAMADLHPGAYVRVGLGPAPVAQAVSADVAWFLGAMVGDGYIRAGGCSFSNVDPGVLAAMRRVLGDLGGGLPDAPRGSATWDILTGGNRRGGSPVRRLLKQAGLIGTHSHSKRVPDMVLQGGPAAWAGFLSGYLDTDGSVRDPDGSQKPALYWASVNRPLLEDCQHLLALLGIQSALYAATPAGTKAFGEKVSPARPGWALYLMGTAPLQVAAAVLQPAHGTKAARLAAFGARAPSRYRPENFDYDRIIAVEPLPPGETIGVEIAGVHTHITSGLVTHNSRKHQRSEIASWFRVPPHMIGDVERTTSWGTGIEQQSIGFVTYTLSTRLKNIETGTDQALLPEAEWSRSFSEFVVDGLLRGDAAGRAAYLQTLRQNGVINADQWARLENLPPPPPDVGAAYFMPSNMAPVDLLLNPPEPEPPAQEPPPALPEPEEAPRATVLPVEERTMREYRCRGCRRLFFRSDAAWGRTEVVCRDTRCAEHQKVQTVLLGA